MQALALDFLLACPHCDTETWASDAHRLSSVDYEWECRGCERLAYKDLS